MPEIRPCKMDLQIIEPGNQIPLNSKVKITQSGTYETPNGATLLTTRCCGSVTVAYTPPGEDKQSNSCQSAEGSSSQTNVITGVEKVDFTLTPGSHVEVTLK